MELPAMCTHVPDASVPIRFRERSDLADKRAAGKPAAFLFYAYRDAYRDFSTSIQIGICRAVKVRGRLDALPPAFTRGVAPVRTLVSGGARHLYIFQKKNAK